MRSGPVAVSNGQNLVGDTEVLAALHDAGQASPTAQGPLQAADEADHYPSPPI